MSIIGISKELYIGKSEVNILDKKRKKKTIVYSDIIKIDYRLADKNRGYLAFSTIKERKYDFLFNENANDAVLRAINYIKDKCPDIPIYPSNEESDISTQGSAKNISHQKCKNCGKEYDSDTDICPYCNYSNSDTHFKWLFIGLGITIVISIIAFITSYFMYGKPMIDMAEDEAYPSQTYESTSVEQKTSETTEAFTTTLTTGNYLVGTDIPEGTYSFYSKKGTGNLISSDGSINAIFDHDNDTGKQLEEYGINSFGTEELKNIYLKSGVVVSVIGAQEVSAGCDDGLVSSMTSRNQNLKELEIGYGNFGCDSDIPPGTYDIIWLEGNGNITSDSSEPDNTINEIMGNPEKVSLGSELDDMLNDLNEKMYIQSFKNFTINVGDILKIPELKVKLIPSK